MELGLKERLFKIMDGEHHIFHPVKHTDFYQELPSKGMIEVIENLAFEFNGKVHYYREVYFEVRITYKFKNPVENYLFRHALWQNLITYQTTGFNTSTYIELAS
jgi:hypothetical protein